MTHLPVLVAELLDIWRPKTGDRLLDATLGLGGHARAFLEASLPAGMVVGLEADEEALAQAKHSLAEFGERVIYVHGNFSQLKDLVAHAMGLRQGGEILQSFSHVHFDLGVGSHQLADPARGFSFHSSGPLLMKYGQVEDFPPSNLAWLNQITGQIGHLPEAVEILAVASADQLAELIRLYGEERYSQRIAQAIKESAQVPVRAAQLADLIAQAVPAGYERGRIHPATRTFQALRLAVNRELEALQAALPQALGCLAPGGWLTVISFHSLEDRLVKWFLRQHQRQKLTIVTKRPLRAGEVERQANPRARGAKLRAARKM